MQTEPTPFHKQAKELADVVNDHLKKNHHKGTTWTQLHNQLANHANNSVKKTYDDFQKAVKEANDARFKNETNPYATQKNGLLYLLSMTKDFELDEQGKIRRKT